MTTGQLIQQARKSAGLSQKQLGEKLGLSASMIGQWENDLRNPKYETIKRIASALNVGWRELISDEQRGQVMVDHIKAVQRMTAVNVANQMMAGLGELSDEEGALKTLLNSIGYDVIKTGGNYFFTYESGGSEISADDLNELLNCAQNGLKVAAKTLELKLMQGAHASLSRAETAPESPPAPQEGTDTTSTPDAPETLSEEE